MYSMSHTIPIQMEECAIWNHKQTYFLSANNLEPYLEEQGYARSLLRSPIWRSSE